MKHNQDGAISGLAISLVLCVILLIGTMGFAGWAFTSRQDYKNNTDQKIAAANKVAVQQESKLKDAEFAQEAKKPLTTYRGPDTSGSVVVKYPKTWSGYADDSESSKAGLLDVYFNPGVVPSLDNQNSIYALRVQVLNQQYSEVLEGFTNQQQDGKAAISVYSLPKLPKVVGVRIKGQVINNKEVNVDMVVLPMRSQTLQIWTEGDQYEQDFNDNILPNFTFLP